ncbi:alpha-amylase family glycosyl hydrolase [Actinoplanes sp. NPDC026619]|uniref:alpha-amylase family glycosyl hydrolase n=1 Tax=Actinoplanes sp. NPDC026619 TaxID=3155798 RepID=UPI0034024C58
MADPTRAAEIDLAPIPGKTYFSIDREWREEFIYFLMVDRFSDGVDRPAPTGAGRSAGVDTPDAFYGGTIAGIRRNLDYIAGLGCTAIWLSPVFENNQNSYHGYDINNYLSIDPRFGTKQDLIDLVEDAHSRPVPIRIILDVVINHSGDNWSYPGGFRYFYSGNQQFGFGDFRRADRPLPAELRNPEWYHRRGEIGDFDNSPENQFGDILGLKDYANDDDPVGSEVINTLIRAHAYWIRETDVDGFRVDAVKHMGELAAARFCSNIREYAYGLGKRGFFLFGEVATPSDDIYNRYIGQNTSQSDGNRTVFFGLDSVLDFRLASGMFGDENNAPLRDVLTGARGPQTLFNRLEAQRDRALNRGEIGRYLVTFIDNHDSFWQPGGRFPAIADDDQVIAAAGFLLCALGTPCLYYGDEQGLTGAGGDNQMRQALFDTAGDRSLLNPQCRIYQEIAKIAAVMRSHQALRFGRMYYRQISGDGQNFGEPFGTTYTLAFARLLYPQEVLVAYNVSDQPRHDCVVVDAALHPEGSTMSFRYGASGDTTVQKTNNGIHFVRLELAPHQFVVLE